MTINRVAVRNGLGRAIPAVATLILCASCATGWHGEERDFRGDMRELVQDVSAYAHDSRPGFIVIPQNGHQLLTLDGQSSGATASDYLAAIDGVGREDLFYGYDGDDVATPAPERDAMLAFMDLAEANGIQVLATDYCSTPAKVDDSYARSASRGYISFAAERRELDGVPAYPAAPMNAQPAVDVSSLASARNFLYLINPGAYATKDAYLSAIDASDYDLVIMDLFYEDADGVATALSQTDLDTIRDKSGGGRRLLVCYMSVGEAEDYRYYWDESWDDEPPSWIAGENPYWAGNYKVEYWDSGWKAVLYGSSGAYLDRVIAAGFDGVYLDIIDAFEYFEEALGL
ncbi:MAG TPA: endo alpha-1,4 polygalactosaminidase [Spirochaetales bacterium]|nr:endo alpha-1,4 polygalactosaminidase [Spirochaetales bacterium]